MNENWTKKILIMHQKMVYLISKKKSHLSTNHFLCSYHYMKSKLFKLVIKKLKLVWEYLSENEAN